MTSCSIRIDGIVGYIALVSVPFAHGEMLVNPDFTNGLTGWTMSESGGGVEPGAVSTFNGQTTLAEGDSFLVTLQQTFTVSANPDMLTFDLSLVPGFDLGDSFIPDAFEVSLLDNKDASVVPTWRPGATSYFNMGEDGTAHESSAATFDGTTVTLDISGVDEGTTVTLFFDLIGGDHDTGSGVRIGGVSVETANEPPVCNADSGNVACEGSTATVSLDGTASSDPDGDEVAYSWSADCPEGSFDEPTIPTPTLSIDSSAGGTITCNVTLTVSDGDADDSCNVSVTIEDMDGDGVGNVCDNCPEDPDKTEPGVCGCGVADVDSDSDTVFDCNDACPGHDDNVDGDSDGVADGCDNCPDDPNPDQADSDGNGVGDACDTPGGPALTIDIYPGRVPNRIRLSRNYTILVGVLRTADFDPADVDWTTVRFGPTGAEASPVRRPSTRDVNRDGLPDALYGFRTFDCGFEVGDEFGILTGALHDGTPVEGQDSVAVKP